MTDLITIAVDWLTRHSAAVLLGSFITLILITVVYIVSIWRLQRLVRRYHTLLNELNQRSLETLLLDQVETTRLTRASVEQFQQRLASLEAAAERHIQRVGVVRFNAFADMGSDLSFAIALLDNNDDGVVISCIQGRQEGRTYAKPITRGRSTYPLAKEELLAIQKSRAAQQESPGPAGKTDWASE